MSIGKVGDSTTSSAKNINTSAITIGADRKNDKNRMHGFAFRFGSDDIDVGNLGSALDMNAFSLTVYETRPSGENMFMDSLIGISAISTGLLNNSGSISTDGERKGKQIFGSIKFRETFAKEKLNITPNIKVDLGFTSLSDYTETGADGLNLKFNRQNIGTIITSIGSVIDNTIDINNGILTLPVILSLENNFEANPFYKSIKFNDEINVKDLGVYLIQEGFIQQAKSIGNTYTEKAINNLQYFKSNEITNILFEIANSIK